MFQVNKHLREEAKKKQAEEDAVYKKLWEAKLDKQEADRLALLEKTKVRQSMQVSTRAMYKGSEAHALVVQTPQTYIPLIVLAALQPSLSCLPLINRRRLQQPVRSASAGLIRTLWTGTTRSVKRHVTVRSWSDKPASSRTL